MFGVATVISGQYSSWNIGLQYGLGSMIVAFAIATVFFWILNATIAELASIMPFTGGSSNFATAAFGPMAGCLEGVCFYSELVTFAAASLLTLSLLFCELYNLTPNWEPLFWCIIILVSIPVFMDLKLFLRVNAASTIISVVLLVIFTFMMIPFATNFTQNITGSNESLLPQGGLGVFYSLPYAIWFYVGNEVIPFLSEETVEAPVQVPKGLMAGMGILTAISIPILLIVPGANPGIIAQQFELLPLQLAIEHNFNLNSKDVSTKVIKFIFLSGFISSWLGCVMGATRSMYALSRAGFLPTNLSITLQRTGLGSGAPTWSILATSTLIIVLCGISFLANDTSGSFLILMCIAYSLLSYLFTLSSYIKLKLKLEGFERIFTSPFGIYGAGFAIIVAVIGLASLSSNPYLRFALLAIACQIVLTVAYFYLSVRATIKFLPEKEFISRQLKEVEVANRNEYKRRSSASRK